MDVNIIFIDSENDYTLLSPFLTSIAKMEVPKLFLLSPTHTSDLPLELKFTVPENATLPQLLAILRGFVDSVALTTFKAPKKQLDFTISKPTVLVHGLGICDAARREFEQINAQNQGQFAEQLKQWEAETKELVQGYHDDNSCIEQVSELPVYVPCKTVHEIFFEACLEAEVAIAGYVQIFDDANMVEYSKDPNFTELMSKLSIPVYSLPKPSAFSEIELFNYIFNPYSERKVVDKVNFIRLPEKIDETEDPKKKKKQVQKKKKEDGFFGADGSILFNKAFKFINENSFVKQKSDDLLIQTGPNFQVKNCGKFIKFYQNLEGLPQVSSVGAKEEKAFLALCKTKFDENTLALSLYPEFINVIDKIGQSGDIYNDWLKKNKVVQFGDLTQAPGLRYMKYFQGDKTKLQHRLVESTDKKPAKPAKGMENMCMMCQPINLYESKSSYLTRLYDEEFMKLIYEKSDLSKQQEEPELDIYTQQLDQLAYHDQNNISSIVEAMLLQLEKQPVDVQQPPLTKSRAASAKKQQEPKSTKPDKNAPPPPQIPFDELNIFGITQKDLNIFSLTTDYNSKPVEIPESFVGAIFGLLTPDKELYQEVNTVITEEGLQILEVSNKQSDDKLQKQQTFLDNANRHDLRLLDFHTEKITEFKNGLINIIKQQKYDEWKAKQIESLEAPDNNNDLSESELAVTATQQAPYIEEDIDVNQAFDFANSFYANYYNKYENISQRNELFALISDFLVYDQNCDESTQLFKIKTQNFQSIEILNTATNLFKVFQNSISRAFQTIPQFNIWINNPIIQQQILKNDLLPLPIKILHRFFLPRLTQFSDEIQEYSQPIYPSEEDKIDITALSGNFCTFNLYDSNIQNIIDSIYGCIQLKKDYHEPLSEIEIEDLRASIASVNSVKSNSRAKSSEKKKKEEPVQLELPEIVPIEDRDTQLYFIHKYVEKQFTNLNVATLDTKLITNKTVLDLNYLPDFDIQMPSIAPQFDILPAQTRDFRLTDINSLGMHYIDSYVSNSSLKHTILNPNAEVLQIRITPIEIENFTEQIAPPSQLTPDFNPISITSHLQQFNPSALIFPEAQSLDDLNAKQLKAIKDNENQQQQEFKKRKKRIQELADISQKIQLERSEKVAPLLEKTVNFSRVVKSRASATIASSDIRIFFENDEFQLCQNDLKILANLTKNETLIQKTYRDVRFDVLGSFDYTLDANESNLLIQIKERIEKEDLSKVHSFVEVSYRFNQEKISCEVRIPCLKCLERTEKVNENGEKLPFCADKTINLFSFNLSEIQKLIAEKNNNPTILSNSGTSFTESQNEFYAKSAVQRILDKEVKNDELLSLDSFHYFPQLQQESRTFNYHFNQIGLLRLAQFSSHLDFQEFKNLLPTPANSYSTQPYFFNLLQQIHSVEEQQKLQNPGKYTSQIREILTQQTPNSTLFLLPFNVSIFLSENAIFNVILTYPDACDFLQVQKNSARFCYADSLEISANNLKEPIFYVSGSEKSISMSPEQICDQFGEKFQNLDIYSYYLHNTHVQGPNLHFRVSEPYKPFMLRPRDPVEFLPDRNQILKPEEKAAKSLIMFAPGAKTPEIVDFTNSIQNQISFSPNLTSPDLSIFMQFSATEDQILSSLIVSDSQKQTLISTLIQNSNSIQQVFLADIDACFNALLTSSPKFKIPNFLQIQLKHPFVETNIQSLQEFKDPVRNLSFAQSENTDQLVRNLPCPSQVLNTDRKTHNTLQLDFKGKFDSKQSYWSSLEGSLWVKGEENQGYYENLIQQDENCKKFLNNEYVGQREYESSVVVSGNLVKKILQNYEKTTVPRKLPQIQQKTIEMKQIKPITKVIRQLDKEAIVSASISENYALAGFNQEIIEREGKTMRKTKNSSLNPGMECRTLLVQPNSIRIEFSTDELEELKLKNKKQKSIQLFYKLFCRNTGRESLHVRWDRNVILDSSIKNVEIPMKSGGLPAGLGTEIIIEFGIKFDIEEGETLDALVLKTEEEIISVPISIWIGDKQETIIIDKQVPRSVSQMGQEIQDQLGFNQSDLIKTTTIQPEVIELGGQNDEEQMSYQSQENHNYEQMEPEDHYVDCDVQQDYQQDNDFDERGIETINTESQNFESFERLDEDMVE